MCQFRREFRQMLEGLRSLLAICGVTVAIGVAVVVAFVVPIRYGMHWVATTDCREFSAATGRQVKFVDYTWFTWDCLVQTDLGRWVPRDALRDVS